MGRAFPSADDDADRESAGTSGDAPDEEAASELTGGDALGEMVRSLTGGPQNDGATGMRDVPSTPPPPPGAPGDAALSCSLAVFDLGAVLTMLASTGQSGTLTVVGPTGGTLLLDAGALIGADVGGDSRVADAVFQLLLAGVGSCFFSPTRPDVDAAPPVERRPVEDVLAEVRPRLAEWNELRGALPDDAVVRLASTPPGDDVRIPGHLWGVLTVVDRAGRPVAEIVEAADGETGEVLRALATLRTIGLVTVASGAPEAPLPPANLEPTAPLRTDATAPFPGLSFDTDPGTDDTEAITSADEDPEGPADMMVLPPPIVDDPWSPLPQHRPDPPVEGEAPADTPSVA